MKNKSLYCLAISAVALSVGSVALAAPYGFYTFVGGGGAYLESGQLKSASVTETLTDPFSANYAINYSRKNSVNYALRGAVGYFFPHDPESSHAFGLEAGYNYFGNQKSTAKSELNVPFVTQPFPVKTTDQTSAMSTDLEGVFSQDLGCHTNLLFKLGMGYETMTQKITNTVAIPNQIPASATINNNGIGVAGGMGVQYNFTKHVAARVEFDGLKGSKQIGYGEGLAGLVFKF